MHDSDFEDSVARMLQRRAAGLASQGDPVGLTRGHLKSARIRRQAVGSATAVLVVAAGAALGGQAFGAGHGGAGATDAAAGSPTATATAGTPTQSATTSNTIDGAKELPPPVDQHGQPCGNATKVIHRDVAGYTDGLRGSLAGHSDLVASLKARAVTLADGAHPDAAKVVYAGEDASTRLVVVFVNPKSTTLCEKGMLAVVFHGPAGTPAEDLKAQVGYAAFGPDFGFTWAERNADHSMSALVLNPAAIRSVQPAGDVTGHLTGAIGPAVDTPDGSYLTTYPAGSTVPEFFDFQTPAGAQGTSTLNIVVAASTKQAYADAVGATPDQINEAPWQSSAQGIATHMYGVGSHDYFQLVPTAGVTKGAEAAYWADYSGG